MKYLRLLSSRNLRHSLGSQYYHTTTATTPPCFGSASSSHYSTTGKRTAFLFSVAATGTLLFQLHQDNNEGLTVAATSCESSKVENPVWPSGVSAQEVDALVDEILRDPTMNLPTVPDYIERQLYRSTIIMTMNTVYETLGQMHGEKFLGHRIHLERKKISNGAYLQRGRLRHMSGDIDEQVLENMADRLLANKAINQSLIPDFIERQLYVSCIKLVFRILDMMANSFKLTVCGHDFSMKIEKNEFQLQQLAAANRVVSSLTEIDTEALQKYARNMGVQSSKVTDMSWIQRMISAPQEELLAQLHSTLYALILGIVDDFFANTSIVLMNDSIQFDIVASDDDSDEEDSLKRVATDDVKGSSEGESTFPSSSGPGYSVLAATFTAGLGLGMATGAILLSSFR